MQFVSSLTQKGQATIPLKIRKKLSLSRGDKVLFEIDRDVITIKKAQPIDVNYLRSMQKTLTSEWSSSEDCKAYDCL